MAAISINIPLSQQTNSPPPPQAEDDETQTSRRIQITYEKAISRFQRDVEQLGMPDGIAPLQMDDHIGIRLSEIVGFSEDLQSLLFRDFDRGRLCYNYFHAVATSFSKHLSSVETEITKPILIQMEHERSILEKLKKTAKAECSRRKLEAKDKIASSSAALDAETTVSAKKEKLIRFRRDIILYENFSAKKMYFDALARLIEKHIPAEDQISFDIEMQYSAAGYYLHQGQDRMVKYQLRKLQRLGQLHTAHQETIDKMIRDLNSMIQSRVEKTIQNFEIQVKRQAWSIAQSYRSVLLGLSDIYEQYQERIQKLINDNHFN